MSAWSAYSGTCDWCYYVVRTLPGLRVDRGRLVRRQQGPRAVPLLLGRRWSWCRRGTSGVGHQRRVCGLSRRLVASDRGQL
eukprot:1376329-Prymnesium_polylepis.1